MKNNNFIFKFSIAMLILSLIEFIISAVKFNMAFFYIVESFIVAILLFILLLYFIITFKKRKWYEYIIVLLFIGSYVTSFFMFFASVFWGGMKEVSSSMLLQFPGVIRYFKIIYDGSQFDGNIESILTFYRFSPNFIMSLIISSILFIKTKK